MLLFIYHSSVCVWGVEGWGVGVGVEKRVFKNIKMCKPSHLEIPLLGFYAVKVMPQASKVL